MEFFYAKNIKPFRNLFIFLASIQVFVWEKYKILKNELQYIIFLTLLAILCWNWTQIRRVFLYRCLAHIREQNERLLVIPIAEPLLSIHYAYDVEHFLISIKLFCIQNCIPWPICKRIYLDWSSASINAVFRVFHKEKIFITLSSIIFKFYTI